LASAAIGVALVAAGSTAVAATGHAGPASPPSDSRRAIAAQVGLRMGSAIIPFDLDNPQYAQTAANQFSVVTPGNEMKWQVVEPQEGVFDWSGADRLVQFAQAHGEQVRGHVL